MKRRYALIYVKIKDSNKKRFRSSEAQAILTPSLGSFDHPKCSVTSTSESLSRSNMRPYISDST